MRLRAMMNEACPECGGQEIDLLVERKDDGTSDAFVRCVECDRTIVLRGVTISPPEPCPIVEGDESVEVERLDGAVLDAIFNVGSPIIDPELVERMKESFKAFEDLAKRGGEFKVEVDESNFRPPPKKSFPPPGQGRGGRTFFYRGGGQR